MTFNPLPYKNDIERGKTAGILALWTFLLSLLQGTLLAFDEGNTALLVVGVVLSLALGIAYIFLLLGVKALAQEISDTKLEKNLHVSIIICALLCPIIAFGPLVGKFVPEAELISALILVAFIIPLGIISIRLGKNFKEREAEFGPVALKIAKWHKVSGYLMVTLILSGIGFITSLMADLYMWRLLKNRPSIPVVPVNNL